MTDIKKIIDKNLDKKFNVVVSVNELNEAINKEAENQKDKIKIDGFRKGKVPVEFIKNKYSALLLSEAAENIVNNIIDKIMKDNNYNLIARPNVNVKTLENGKDFEFEVSFELYPQIPEIDYSKINLEKDKVNMDEQTINDNLNNILKTKLIWKEQNKDYAAKNGDRVKIDFLGKIDGVPFDGGKAENYNLDLGSKSFIDTFEDQLIGKKAGDEVNVNVTFPESYHKKELAGKPAVFEVKVHSVSVSEKPELTEEFLEKNFYVKSIDELKSNIEKELLTMYNSVIQNKVKTQVFEWLKKNVKIELSESMINQEFEREWLPIENELKTNPNKFKNETEKEKEKEKIRQNAEESVKLGLILSEIGKRNNIKVENAEIVEEIRKRASAYPGQEQMIFDFYTKNKQAIEQLTGIILEDKVIDFICQKSNVKYNDISAADFMKKTM